MLHADALLECAGVPARIHTEHRNAAFVPLPEALDALHRSGLAGAVGPDQAEDLPPADLERDARHGDGGAVPFLKVRDLDDGIDHVCPTGACGGMFILCSIGGRRIS